MQKLQKRYLIPLVLVFAAAFRAPATTSPALRDTPEAIGHALNRLAFGPRSADADAITRIRGQVLANLKTGGMKELLEELTTQLQAAE